MDKKPQVREIFYDHDGKVRYVKEWTTIEEMSAHYRKLWELEERNKNEPENGCWNCMNFNWDREACTVNWNNMDESYYNPNTDNRDYFDYCENHETDPDADWEEIFGGEE